MIAPERLLEVFVDVADTLVAEFDLIDFLHTLTEHVAEVSDATIVGIMLADERDQPQFMAASNDDAKSIELFQIQAAEGPCLDCFHTGTPVSVPDLAAESGRWPVFSPGARERGVRSVHAFPMRLRHQVIGALNVFSDDVSPLGPDDVRIIQSMADIATIGILQERALSAAETLTTQLQGALNSRIVIEQAKGVLAQTLGVDVDNAFRLMRSNARSHQQRLLDTAEDVVNQRVDFSTWTA